VHLGPVNGWGPFPAPVAGDQLAECHVLALLDVNLNVIAIESTRIVSSRIESYRDPSYRAEPYRIVWCRTVSNRIADAAALLLLLLLLLLRVAFVLFGGAEGGTSWKLWEKVFDLDMVW
jgi:hypothetical protein